ncbi:unnamed protein product [Linum tenue]|uniref:BAG family molecular chaperone regulator 4 n=1 Tax=Linum tenue TaxID=586396 RepID=A0AAV0KW16_9ROSI|nr:unnamed protein product [Linum tenue]
MIIEQRTGLECGRQKLLFRGKEKEDGEYLHDAGVKDNAKILVLEEPVSAEKELPEMPQPEVKGREEETSTEDIKEEEQQPSISEVEDKEEILKALREQVSALEVAINCGTKVAEKEFVVSAELLMRQLLKLDMIEAEGEARVQRKAEVRRIQNFHELLDNLKATNAKPVNTNVNVATVTTDWETFDSGMGSLTPPPPGTSSSTAITEEWERFD